MLYPLSQRRVFLIRQIDKAKDLVCGGNKAPPVFDPDSATVFARCFDRRRPYPSFIPVSLSSASRYFSEVLRMISSGRGGGGACLFQSRVSR